MSDLVAPGAANKLFNNPIRPTDAIKNSKFTIFAECHLPSSCRDVTSRFNQILYPNRNRTGSGLREPEPEPNFTISREPEPEPNRMNRTLSEPMQP